MSENRDWHELIDRHLRGELNEPEKERLTQLLDADSALREDFVEQARWDTRIADVLRESRGSPRQQNVIENADETPVRRTPKTTFMAIAAVAIVVLTASFYFQRASVEHQIAKITGLNGSLQWTGDGGRVFHDLSLGAELHGGTIEGMEPGSWFELQFNDGSTVTISGNSTLTFSDHGQKELHLKEGSIAANVKPQPPGKPMRIHTRSATLEVVGTQFEVEAELSATMLNVSHGKVRVVRLSDGRTVDVFAKHRLTAAADQEMLPEPVPDSVSHWKSQLQFGPAGGRGKWAPKTEEQDATLAAIPYTAPQGITIYTATFDVSRGDKPPVILQPDSRLRVRGRMESTHEVYFGITVRHPNGEFAGRFQTTRPADEFPAGQDFETLLHLDVFMLDPSLAGMEDKLPDSPFGLVVESLWCHTLGEPAGLELSEMELISPDEDIQPRRGR